MDPDGIPAGQGGILARPEDIQELEGTLENILAPAEGILEGEEGILVRADHILVEVEHSMEVDQTEHANHRFCVCPCPFCSCLCLCLCPFCPCPSCPCPSCLCPSCLSSWCSSYCPDDLRCEGRPFQRAWLRPWRSSAAVPAWLPSLSFSFSSVKTVFLSGMYVMDGNPNQRSGGLRGRRKKLSSSFLPSFLPKFLLFPQMPLPYPFHYATNQTKTFSRHLFVSLCVLYVSIQSTAPDALAPPANAFCCNWEHAYIIFLWPKHTGQTEPECELRSTMILVLTDLFGRKQAWSIESPLPMCWSQYVASWRECEIRFIDNTESMGMSYMACTPRCGLPIRRIIGFY